MDFHEEQKIEIFDNYTTLQNLRRQGDLLGDLLGLTNLLDALNFGE